MTNLEGAPADREFSPDAAAMLLQDFAVHDYEQRVLAASRDRPDRALPQQVLPPAQESMLRKMFGHVVPFTVITQSTRGKHAK
ncbi:MAG: hypothetical protein WBP26_05115 [Candidatus Saccharimonadales bacterium]